MKCLDLYRPVIASEHAFVNSYGDNENLRELARRLWNELNNLALVFVLIALIFAFLFCIGYYVPYNNKPGRHYRVRCWLWFGVICMLIAIVSTLLLEDVVVKTNINGDGMCFFLISLWNGVYAFLAYWLISVMWCWCLPTNAYRFWRDF